MKKKPLYDTSSLCNSQINDCAEEQLPLLNELTDEQFWRKYHRVKGPKLQLPSKLSVFNWDIKVLLRKHIRPGMKVLEIGCAPGRLLAWVAKKLKADVAGIDSSLEGMNTANKLFDILGLEADLRCEDVFATSFACDYFDVVYSTGVIEHFKDPANLVRIHVELLKPGGMALLTVPNYTGIYKWVEEWFDPDITKVHNTKIMTCQALKDLAPVELSQIVRTFPTGRLGAWLISYHLKWPPFFVFVVGGTLHLIGMLQPCRLPGLNSMWALEIVRKDPLIDNTEANP